MTGELIDPKLVARARTLIARLELVSHGTTASYDSDGGHTAFDSRPPKSGHAPAPKGPEPMIGARDPEYLVLRRRLARATTDSHVRGIIALAERELLLAQQQPSPADPVKGTLHWYRMIATSTKPLGELASFWGISRRQIYRIRERYGPLDDAA